MTLTQSLILGLAAVAAIVIVFKVAQKLLKFVLLLVVIALAIYFWRGGTVQALTGEGAHRLFKQSGITDMLAVNCPDPEPSPVKCMCIIRPVHADLTSRYSTREIAALEQDEAQLESVIKASLARQEKEIRTCLIQHKGPEYLDKLKSIWGQLKSAAKEGLSQEAP